MTIKVAYVVDAGSFSALQSMPATARVACLSCCSQHLVLRHAVPLMPNMLSMALKEPEVVHCCYNCHGT